MKDEIASQLKPRLFGVLLVIIALLLLLIGFLLMAFLQPEAGQYYSRWVVALVVLVMLAGFGLLFPGLWKAFVGPGVGMGMFTGLLKVVAVGAMLVGLGFAGLYSMAVYSMATQPTPKPSSSSTSSHSSSSDWLWD
jgi:hypothetical protein